MRGWDSGYGGYRFYRFCKDNIFLGLRRRILKNLSRAKSDFAREVNHVDGGFGCLAAFVAVDAADALVGLLLIFYSQ